MNQRDGGRGDSCGNRNAAGARAIAAKVLACVLMAVFVFIPFPGSGLVIRLNYEDLAGDRLMLYYTTDESPDIVAEQVLTAEIDPGRKTVTFRLPSELADHIAQIRLDFPETEQLISIRNVSVSSAGVVKHNYNPCDFFSEDNIVFQNDIPAISIVEIRESVFLKTEGADPYILFREELVQDMLGYRSTYRLTRLAMCLLVVLGYLIYRSRLFGGRRKTQSFV